MYQFAEKTQWCESGANGKANNNALYAALALGGAVVV
jgi:hypothetical protein